MQEQIDWYHNLGITAEKLKAQLGSDARDYYFDRFMKIARRVDEFATNCQHCREYQFRMDNMLEELSISAPYVLKEQKRAFLGSTNFILSHLKKSHGLISDGQNVGIWLAIGVAIGTALGTAFGNPAIGIPIGTGLGIVIGITIDGKARKNGKII